MPRAKQHLLNDVRSMTAPVQKKKRIRPKTAKNKDDDDEEGEGVYGTVIHEKKT